MKFQHFYFGLLVASLSLYSCGGDDNDGDMPTDDPMETTLEEEQAITLTNLTGDAEKVWFIDSASLTNDNGTFNISDAFNIKDDEFYFSGDADTGNLQWRPGYDVNVGASNAQESALDYYLPPSDYSFSFNPESPNELTSIDGQFVFTVLDDQTITGTIVFASRNSAGEELTLTLTPKTPGDFLQAPQSGLNFSLVTSTQSTGTFFGETTGGMIGSYSDNSLFLVDRINDNPNGTEEQIMKYNLNTGAWTTNLYLQSQFVTKRLNIINNELIVFGGQIVSTYPLNPSGAPTNEFLHDLGLTRFGFTVQGDLGYIVGNGLDGWDQPAKVRSYNYLTNQIQEITTLPKPRVYGGSEIANNQLFVFGGRADFLNIGSTYDGLDGECFKVDLATGTITSFNMPQVATISYAARLQNLIYVGYETRNDADGDNNIDQDDRTIHFAVYNTNDDTFTEISHNLDDSDMFSTIHAISIFNGSLYVAYGAPGNTPFEIKIFAAPL